MLYRAPALLHRLLAILAESVTGYLRAQAEAGAQALMIFDTWGGMLSAQGYQEFSLRYLSVIVNALRLRGTDAVPVIVFTKGGGQWLEAIADTGADALGIDWTTDIGNARRRIGARAALQGNLDPAVLYGTREAIRTEVGRILDAYGAGSGHVFNLGHGITPDIDPDNVAALIEAVHELSARYHRDTPV